MDWQAKNGIIVLVGIIYMDYHNKLGLLLHNGNKEEYNQNISAFKTFCCFIPSDYSKSNCSNQSQTRINKKTFENTNWGLFLQASNSDPLKCWPGVRKPLMPMKRKVIIPITYSGSDGTVWQLHLLTLNILSSREIIFFLKDWITLPDVDLKDWTSMVGTRRSSWL